MIERLDEKHPNRVSEREITWLKLQQNRNAHKIQFDNLSPKAHTESEVDLD